MEHVDTRHLVFGHSGGRCSRQLSALSPSLGPSARSAATAATTSRTLRAAANTRNSMQSSTAGPLPSSAVFRSVVSSIMRSIRTYRDVAYFDRAVAELRRYFDRMNEGRGR